MKMIGEFGDYWHVRELAPKPIQTHHVDQSVAFAELARLACNPSYISREIVPDRTYFAKQGVKGEPKNYAFGGGVTYSSCGTLEGGAVTPQDVKLFVVEPGRLQQVIAKVRGRQPNSKVQVWKMSDFIA